MSGLSFLNSTLMWGMLLASIPVIIHLLNRRRFRKVEWAPMTYLKLSIKRNRRRIRIEQLILLACRIAMILLLFATVARPILNAQVLGNWFGPHGRRSHIYLVDDSLSMSFKVGGTTAIDRAKNLAVKLLDTVGPEDRLTLAVTSKSDAPLLHEVETADPTTVRNAVAEIEAMDVHNSWPATLAGIDKLLTSTTYPIRELSIFTDLRGAGWEQRAAEITQKWSGKHISIKIFDIGSAEQDNVSLLDLVQVDRIALANVPIRWEATVRNRTSKDLLAEKLTLTVDGKPTEISLPTIPAGQSIKVPLITRFTSAGTHSVTASTGVDSLANDNSRFAVVSVRDHLSIQVVDGEPSSEAFAGESDFVALALGVGVGVADAWQVQVVTESEWSGAPIRIGEAPIDLMILCNVASITTQRATELERLVRDGMGLMIFVGDQLDESAYNSNLYKDGAGLLPARLLDRIDEESSGLALEDVTPSALATLRLLRPAVLERIKIRKHLRVAVEGESKDGGRVLARWNTSDSAPALVSKNFGAGKVLLWSITADKAWSDWPTTESSYVFAVRETTQAIARSQGEFRSLTSGDTLRRPTLAANVTRPIIDAPSAKAPMAMRVEKGTPEPGQSNPPQSLVFDDTRRAGIYRMTWREGESKAIDDAIAVNPDRRESDLDRISSANVREFFKGLEIEVISAESMSQSASSPRGEEIWRTFCWVLVGFVFVESCLATWVGRQR